MNAPAVYDFAPLLPMLALGAVLALVPAAWVAWRQRSAGPAERRNAWVVLTLFLTFDLVLFGAFTRLTDSGLGCPDWPGCYGNTSPVGAHGAIDAAQTAMPGGPVTHGKAWVEMLHRYLATGVGGLILLSAALAWRARWTHRRGDDPAPSPVWPTVTLLWVVLQGAFGAWTVTMKLYPAIVTAHLLGGIGLLALLAVQSRAGRPRIAMPRTLWLASCAVAGWSLLQVALGGWVSTNYAVLACREFPSCQGSLWPAMDFGRGFTLLRGLGVGPDGEFLPFAALTAIHYVHRMAAYVVLVAIALLAWRLHATGGPLRRWGQGVAAVGAWQLLSGLANVVLGWPMAAALAHTGGAAVLIALLAVLVVHGRVARPPASVQQPYTAPVRAGRLRRAP